MTDQSPRRRRLLAAVLSAVPAAALAVLVNVWTTGWAWSAGVAVAVLVLGQIAAAYRAPAPGEQRDDAIDARIRLRKVRGGNVTAADLDTLNPGRNIRARMRAGDVENAQIIGVRIRRSHPRASEGIPTPDDPVAREGR